MPVFDIEVAKAAFNYTKHILVTLNSARRAIMDKYSNEHMVVNESSVPAYDETKPKKLKH
jgi:hypothetical protein